MASSGSKRWRWILPVAVLLLLGTVGWIRRDKLDPNPLPVESKLLAGLPTRYKFVQGTDMWCVESTEIPELLEVKLRKELQNQAVPQRNDFNDPIFSGSLPLYHVSRREKVQILAENRYRIDYQSGDLETQFGKQTSSSRVYFTRKAAPPEPLWRRFLKLFVP